jgi:hypothetical protein
MLFTHIYLKIVVLGIDLGKNVCSVVGLDVSGDCGPMSAGPEGYAHRLVAKLLAGVMAWRHVAAATILVACSQLRDTTFD